MSARREGVDPTSVNEALWRMRWALEYTSPISYEGGTSDETLIQRSVVRIVLEEVERLNVALQKRRK